MPQQIEVPGMGIVEFPDGMSDADIASAIQRNMSTPTEAQPAQRSLGNRNIGLTTSLGDIEPALQDAPQKAAVGLGRSFQNLGESAKQIGLGIGEKLGLVPEGRTQEYTRQADAERALYQSTPYGQSGIAKGAEFIGDTLPFLAVPGGMAGGLAARAGTGALAGTGIGAAQYVPEGGSRTMNAVIGGSAGAGAPVGLAVGGKLIDAGRNVTGKAIDFIKKHSGDQNAIAQEMLRGVDPQAAMKTKRAAERLGLNLTPAEASGSQIAAKQQGKLGVSEAGEEALQAFGKQRTAQEKSIIGNFLDNLSPDKSIAASDIRSTAQKIISTKEKALSQTAKPLYESAYQKTLPDEKLAELMQDDVIAHAVQNVTKNPAFAKDLKDVPPTSIKFLDYAKKYIDDMNGTALRSGEKNTVRLITDSKQKLVNALDEISPDYKAARAIYGEGAKPLERLKNSNLGKIAELDDVQLKTVSKKIFDPSETDPKVLSNLRDEITKTNPDAWRRVIRNEMERRLDIAKGARNGSTFYNQILGRDRDFKQFLVATKGMPDVQRKLIDMRRSFKDLINPESVKGTAGKSRSSLDVPRSTYEAILNYTNNVLGGKYDQGAIKLITSNKWDREFKAITKIQSKPLRTEKFGALLGKISALSATEPDPNEDN